MHYTYPPEEYVKLLNEYLELGKTAFSPEDSQETVLNKLKQRTAELRRIADRANTMIGEYVEPFLKAPETMTASSAEALEAFLEVLFPSDSALGQDVAITYQVLKLLLDYYRDSGDSLRYAQALFQCTTQELALGTFHSERRYSGSPYLKECLALAERFRELTDEAANLAVKALSMSIFSQQGFDYALYWKADDVLCAALSDTTQESNDVIF